MAMDTERAATPACICTFTCHVAAVDGSDRYEAIVTLQDTLPVLADDEVRVLALVATRLAAGQRRYGRLSLRTDHRDWHTEAIEECADGLAYLAAALVRVEGQRG